MSRTANYGLYLMDNSSQSFKEWSEQLNYGNNSTIAIIDEVLGDKADHSTTVSATLLASAWAGNSAPFTQTVSITGLTATSNGVVRENALPGTDAKTAAQKALLEVTAQANGTITVSAYKTKPTVDIPIIVMIVD